MSPAALSRLLSEFHSSRLRYQNPEPWKALVPLLVTTFITEPAARPYSAANWLVMQPDLLHDVRVVDRLLRGR